MTPQNFRQLAEKNQQELLKLLRSGLPRLLGTKAMQHFRGNFARGGFMDSSLQAWPSTWRHSAEVFAAFKVHRAQNDMAARLLDSNGRLKSFEQWSNDVLPIASHQFGPWLRTEYDTAVIRAHQAAEWQRFERDKDILPNIRWELCASTINYLTATTLTFSRNDCMILNAISSVTSSTEMPSNKYTRQAPAVTSCG